MSVESLTAPAADAAPVSMCATFSEYPDAVPHSGRGEYCAVVDYALLPPALEAAGRRVCRGAAVDVGDRWAFFDDLASAAGFARAGRMSNLMPSWDLFEAAEVRAFCTEHARDELALLLGRQVYDRAEIHALSAQFARSAARDARVVGWLG
jgi:hypothetical protein